MMRFPSFSAWMAFAERKSTGMLRHAIGRGEHSDSSDLKKSIKFRAILNFQFDYYSTLMMYLTLLLSTLQ